MLMSVARSPFDEIHHIRSRIPKRVEDVVATVRCARYLGQTAMAK